MRSCYHKVQYYETDRMGITHHSNYIRWMEEARVDLLEQVGWGYDRMEANGIQSPVTALSCQYCSPSTFGDVIEITAAVAGFHGVSLDMSYVMKQADGRVVCKASSSHCFLNREGHFLRIKREFPELYALLLELAGKAKQEPPQ